MTRGGPAAALLFASLAVAQGATADASVLERTGKYFVVHCHDGDERLADEALAAVERVWPLATTALGIADAAPPAPPLPVHLYCTVAGYEAAEERLTGGKFRRNLAMSHFGSRSAHVALQPPCSDETLRAIGLPALTVELLAWEAVHVVRFASCSNFETHPMWFVDGLASSIARRVHADLAAVPVESLPTAATAQWRVQQLLLSKKLPPADAILRDRIDDLDIHDRYAARWMFFSQLQQPAFAKEFGSLTRAVREAKSADAAAVAKAVDKSRVAELGRAFTKAIGDARPRWSETFRLLAIAGGALEQIAFPDRNAIAWNLEPVVGGKFTASGSMRILPGDARQMNFLFGRNEAGDFWSLAFVADAGVTAFRFTARNDEWRSLGRFDAPALRLGVSTRFTVKGSGKKLDVSVDGKSWSVELAEAIPDRVQWGLGAQAGRNGAATGTAGIWEAVEVVAPKR